MIKPVTYQGVFNFKSNLYALEVKSRFIDQSKANGYYTGYGNELAATIVNNQIQIGTGAFIIQGRMNEVESAETLSVTIENGKVGYVIARIETYHPSDEENCKFVIKTATSLDNISLTQEDTYAKGAETSNKVYELPIYSFAMADGNITSLTKLIKAVADYSTIKTIADNAEKKAAAAIDTSASAVSTAESAVTTAKSAVSTVESAVTTAESAVSTAESAVSTAENAVETANTTKEDVQKEHQEMSAEIKQLAEQITGGFVRRDTAENWEAANTILVAGEIGYDTTNKITKIGDGVTAWNDLPYFVTKQSLKISTFADTDWETIAQVAEEGTASEYFNVGDEKTITLSTGEQVTLVILGFNHDDLTSGGKAGMSIGMKNSLATTYPMNASNTNTGGWNDSVMRTDTMITLLSQLPADLQAVIKSVNKKSTNGGGSSSAPVTATTTSSDKLWLLAFAEIFSKTSIEGSSTSSIKNNAAGYEAEGEQYDYYKTLIGDNNGGTSTNAALIKYLSNGDGSAYFWWLRSPYVTYAAFFWYINGSGDASYYYASDAYGVSFGFCV